MNGRCSDGDISCPNYFENSKVRKLSRDEKKNDVEKKNLPDPAPKSVKANEPVPLAGELLTETAVGWAKGILATDELEVVASKVGKTIATDEEVATRVGTDKAPLTGWVTIGRVEFGDRVIEVIVGIEIGIDVVVIVGSNKVEVESKITEIEVGIIVVKVTGAAVGT